MNSSEAKKVAGDILIIDDTPDNLRFLSDLLTKAGYLVRKVISGELGIEAAQLEPPDLILLDIMMPGMNGYEVCERLKMSDRTSSIPIIFLSALDEELDKVMALQAGAVDYVTKPFQIVEVLARIETHLKISRLQSQLQQQNIQLQQEIEQRTSVETALQILNQGLEERIRQRTATLESINAELLKRQTELEKSLFQEQRLNHLKSQFINTLADEFRSPLARLSKAVERLKRKGRSWSERDNHDLQMISDSSRCMNQLLQKSLALTEVASETLSFNPEPLNLTQVCQSFLEQWQLPETPKYDLSWVSWGKPFDVILADRKLLQQTFSHLLSNAVRYSPQGGTILFELVYEPTQATIRIRDEGIGIPSEEIDRIFDRFYRASNVDRIPATSGGMGLTLVKQAIERHGGSITVSSEVNKGTAFSLTLPLKTESSMDVT